MSGQKGFSERQHQASADRTVAASQGDKDVAGNARTEALRSMMAEGKKSAGGRTEPQFVDCSSCPYAAAGVKQMQA